jgi:hypothetical protein
MNQVDDRKSFFGNTARRIVLGGQETRYRDPRWRGGLAHGSNTQYRPPHSPG